MFSLLQKGSPRVSIFGTPFLLKKRPPLKAVLVPSPVSLFTWAFLLNDFKSMVKCTCSRTNLQDARFKAVYLVENRTSYFVLQAYLCGL